MKTYLITLFLLIPFCVVGQRNNASQSDSIHIQKSCCEKDMPSLKKRKSIYKSMCDLASNEIRTALSDFATFDEGWVAKNYPIAFYLITANLHATMNKRPEANIQLQRAQDRYELYLQDHTKLAALEKVLVRKKLVCIEEALKNTRLFLVDQGVLDSIPDGSTPSDPPSGPPPADSDPEPPSSDPFILPPDYEPGTRIYLVDTIYFKIDQFETKTLNRSSGQKLEELAAILRPCTNCEVIIIGFTDDSGKASYNKELSQKRSESVLLYFKRKGVNISKFETKSFGELGEGSDNKRKVEIHVYKTVDPNRP